MVRVNSRLESCWAGVIGSKIGEDAFLEPDPLFFDFVIFIQKFINKRAKKTKQ